MNISSSDEERCAELKQKSLKIIPWDTTKEMSITDGSKSYSRAVKDFAESLNLTSQALCMEDVNYPVNFTKNSIKESIKQTHDLTSLSKLFTVLADVAKNAVQIEIEPYRHADHPKAQIVVQDRQYLSAFCDLTYVYPVKITVEERRNVKDTNAYVTISVDKIKKEAIPLTGISNTDRTPSGEATSSYTVTIPDFIKNFNNKQSIIIKNLPDGLLSDEQKELKYKVKEHDKNKDNEIRKTKEQQAKQADIDISDIEMEER